MTTSVSAVRHGKTFWSRVKEQKVLILMTLPFLVHVIIFRYVPIWGWLMAFQNYRPGRGILEQTWVGLQNFKVLFDDPVFYQVLRNTLAMSIIKLAMGTVSSIALALMLNEVRRLWFKKTVQTVSYLPHFISWVVAANLVSERCSIN